MTGYGKAEYIFAEHKTTVEIRSLNSKQLDLCLKTAPVFHDKELEIRGLMRESLERGKVDVLISVHSLQSTDSADYTPINWSALKFYLEEYKLHAAELGVPAEPVPAEVLSTFFRLPDVLHESTTEETLSEPFAPLPFGDWKTRLGEGFSGTGEYKMTFRLPENVKEATLDLGKAERVAEVYLNGVPLGKKIMPPYRYPLPNYLLQRENQLSVKVTNGIANEFEGTTAFDKYSEKQLGNYLKEERLFHADSKESGLFGKVKIYIS